MDGICLFLWLAEMEPQVVFTQVARKTQARS